MYLNKEACVFLCQPISGSHLMRLFTGNGCCLGDSPINALYKQINGYNSSMNSCSLFVTSVRLFISNIYLHEYIDRWLILLYLCVGTMHSFGTLHASRWGLIWVITSPWVEIQKSYTRCSAVYHISVISNNNTIVPFHCNGCVHVCDAVKHPSRGAKWPSSITHANVISILQLLYLSSREIFKER